MDQKKRCKKCGTEMDKSAKRCPRCMAKQGGYLKYVLIALGVIFLIGIVAGGNDKDDTPTTTEQDNTVKESGEDTTPAETTAEETEAPKDWIGIGETAVIKDIEVTLVSVTESQGTAYNKPAEGNVYLICEFDIGNQSGKDLGISSLLNFDAYCDDYSVNLNIMGMTASDKSGVDGTVAAGKRMNGILAYEVSAGWQEIEIHFSPTLWSESFVFKANK